MNKHAQSTLPPAATAVGLGLQPRRIKVTSPSVLGKGCGAFEYEAAAEQGRLQEGCERSEIVHGAQLLTAHASSVRTSIRQAIEMTQREKGRCSFSTAPWRRGAGGDRSADEAT